jgi:formamidopyrimidine-DNA glycosylase
MPELPDLQVFSRNLDKRLKGKKVTNVQVTVTKKLNVSEAALKKRLKGQKITKVYRDGKEIHIAFSKGDVLGLHLMLNGDIHLFNGENLQKHTIIEISFSDETGLALTDWQGMATPTLNPKAKPAPDALSPEVNVDFLKEKLRKRSSIKNILLDQKTVRGIGNAYADEILWNAGISPFSIANRIPEKKIRDLNKSIRKVLEKAQKQILRTHPDIINGEVRDFLVIHNPKKKVSPKGGKIEHKMAGGRRTYYTKEQQLFK